MHWRERNARWREQQKRLIAPKEAELVQLWDKYYPMMYKMAVRASYKYNMDLSDMLQEVVWVWHDACRKYDTTFRNDEGKRVHFTHYLTRGLSNQFHWAHERWNKHWGTTNKVICEVCGDPVMAITDRHLKQHGMTVSQYQTLYPDAPLRNENSNRRYRLSWDDIEFLKLDEETEERLLRRKRIAELLESEYVPDTVKKELAIEFDQLSPSLSIREKLKHASREAKEMVEIALKTAKEMGEITKADLMRVLQSKPSGKRQRDAWARAFQELKEICN